MIGKEIYKIWAPSNAKWTEWIRPVPFINIGKDSNNEVINLDIPKVNYLSSLDKSLAIFIDLPSSTSINESIVLLKLGYRPIPLFNGPATTKNAMSTVNTSAVEKALLWASKIIKMTSISNDAPPVFLLDSNRLNRHKMNESVFDNSWDIYPQDIPSPKYFKDNGISKILIRGNNKINKDLEKVLYKYQQEKIEILFTNGYDELKPIQLKKYKDK